MRPASCEGLLVLVADKGFLYCRDLWDGNAVVNMAVGHIAVHFVLTGLSSAQALQAC